MITKRFPIAVVVVVVPVVVVIVVVVSVVGIADVSWIRHNLAVASSHLIVNIMANIKIVNINMFTGDFLVKSSQISFDFSQLEEEKVNVCSLFSSFRWSSEIQTTKHTGPENFSYQVIVKQN